MCPYISTHMAYPLGPVFADRHLRGEPFEDFRDSQFFLLCNDFQYVFAVIGFKMFFYLPFSIYEGNNAIGLDCFRYETVIFEDEVESPPFNRCLGPDNCADIPAEFVDLPCK